MAPAPGGEKPRFGFRVRPKPGTVKHCLTFTMCLIAPDFNKTHKPDFPEALVSLC